MQSDRNAYDEAQAAVLAAIHIVHQAQRQAHVGPARRTLWIHGNEFHRDSLVLLVVLVLVGMYATIALEYVRAQSAADRNQQALALVSAPDTLLIRLAASPELTGIAEGSYWARPGSDVAVLRLDHLPVLPEGAQYRAWVERDNHWTAMGVVTPSVDSTSIIVQGSEVTRPQALRVTVESGDEGNDSLDTSRSVLFWTNQ